MSENVALRDDKEHGILIKILDKITGNPWARNVVRKTNSFCFMSPAVTRSDVICGINTTRDISKLSQISLA